MKKNNPYFVFLEGLLRDLRLTANGFQDKYEIRSFSTIMNKLKNDPEKKLHPETVGRIESALGIKIDDTNPNEITYTKKLKDTPREKFTDEIDVYSYPILATVYAGEPELLDHEVYEETTYFAYKGNGHRCFAVRVNGNSMETTLRSGDTVLVDMDAPLEDGCLVAVKLKNGNQYIKRYYNLNFAFIKLSSDNPDYDVRLIDKNDLLACYRVVSINLKL